MTEEETLNCISPLSVQKQHIICSPLLCLPLCSTDDNHGGASRWRARAALLRGAYVVPLLTSAREAVRSSATHEWRGADVHGGG